jgi:D-glucosaminate-6-phosphate ammonia-lyase
MSGMLERIGVQPVINACGPVTRLGGGLMHPDVAAAMIEASRVCLDMASLQAAACRVIVRVTGAAAGIVTTGASASILLGAAACLAGLDPGRMNRLPDVSDGRRDFIVVRSQRNMYDRALTVAGGRIVEIGVPDRFSGPGVRDAEAWEIDDAIGPNTAGIYYLAQAQSVPRLAEVADIAHKHGIPVLVDAAAQLPPVDNLRRYLADGIDLVAFSGGKAIGGPQASGILCGRADLVSSALIQMLDMDVLPDIWSAPPEFGPLAQLRGLPHHGIGRSCKAGKEEIVGLLAALERFVAEDPATRRAGWISSLRMIIDVAGTLHGMTLTLLDDAARYPVPMLRVVLPGGPPEAAQLARRLREGKPSIQCQTGQIPNGALLFSPVSLAPDHPAQIGARLRETTGSTLQSGEGQL